MSNPRVRQVNQLVEIARPFAQNMKLWKPSLTRELNQYVPFKVSFTLTVIVFIVSTVLHFVFMSVYHRFNLRDFQIFPKPSTKNNAIRPVVQVPRDCPEDFLQKRSKRYPLIAIPQVNHLKQLLIVNKQRHLHLLPLNPLMLIHHASL